MLEEQGSQGISDSKPMSIFQMLIMLEKRGMLDMRLSCHKAERPASVQRGEAADSITIEHEAYSVFKPNPVQNKHVKQSNLAGFIGLRVLQSSQYLAMVWRPSVVNMLVGFDHVQACAHTPKRRPWGRPSLCGTSRAAASRWSRVSFTRLHDAASERVTAA